MPLTCGCYYDDCDWYWLSPEDYSTTPVFRKGSQALHKARRKHCKSCGVLIPRGALGAVWKRFREAQEDTVEAAIYGEGAKIWMADWWHCEECADLAFNFLALGYCIAPDENMKKLLEDYIEICKNENNF